MGHANHPVVPGHEPPALNLARAGNTVTLSWPLSTDPAYGLQSNTNLANAATWSTIATLPVISINQNLVTLTGSNRPTFYPAQEMTRAEMRKTCGKHPGRFDTITPITDFYRSKQR